MQEPVKKPKMKSTIELARECGAETNEFGAILLWPEELKRFRALCRAEALEEAAQVCDTDWNGDSDTAEYADTCNDCADAIRALVQKVNA